MVARAGTRKDSKKKKKKIFTQSYQRQEVVEAHDYPYLEGT